MTDLLLQVVPGTDDMVCLYSLFNCMMEVMVLIVIFVVIGKL